MKVVSIELSAIPASALKQVIKKSNGKKAMFVNLCIGDREKPDNYGNDVTVWVQQTKEEREKEEKIVFVGSGKTYSSKVEKNPFDVESKENESGLATHENCTF
jgi:hypothetical protein